jgi:predicted transcriptional regulator
MRTVKDIINSKTKFFNIISPEETVFNALQMLNTVNLSYLIVMEGDDYKGIFCERDYSRNVILKGRSSADTKVKDVMTIDLPLVAMDDTVEKCMHLINDYKTRYLLAFDDDHLAGVITIHDLLRQVLAAKEDVFEDSIAFKLLEQDEKIY